MGSESSNIDLDVSIQGTETTTAPVLSSSPVNKFTQREDLQKSLSNFSQSKILEADGSFKSNPEILIKSSSAVHISKNKPMDNINLNQETEEDDEAGIGTSKVSSGFAKFRKSISTISKALYNADWKKIGSDTLKIAGNICSGISKAVSYAYNNPGQCLHVLKAAATGILSAAVSFASGAVNEIKNLFTNPAQTLSRLGSFAKSLCDSIGLTDIAAGCYHGLMAVGCLAVFDFKAATGHLSQSTRAIRGAFLALGEFTGITDLGRAVIELSKGNFGKAAFFAAIGAGQIYLICSTLGLGNILSRSGVEAAKEGVRILAKETGQEVVKAVEKKISSEVLEKTGSRVAIDAAKAVLKQWEFIIGDLFAGCKKIVSNTAEIAVEKLLRDNGAKEIVTESTEKLLFKIYDTAVKDLAKEFTLHGIGIKEAEYMARCLKKALWKQGRKSRYHAVLAEEIIDEISEQLNKNLMERGLKKGFEESWLKSVEKIAKFKNLSAETSDLLRKAGFEGFEEGVELAVRKVVREGVEEAFRRFQKMNFNNYGGFADESKLSKNELSVDLRSKGAAKDKLNKNKRKYKNIKIESISRDKSTGLAIKSPDDEDEFTKNKYIEL